MDKKFTEEEKQNIVSSYAEGQSATLLCAKHNIPRSTLYSWIKQYQNLKASRHTPNTVAYNEYHNLKKRTNKLEEHLEIIKAAGCGTEAPLKEKLVALEKLHGKYSVHALCESLDVPRGTFYNHIFRRKEVTAYDKRREEMGELIKEVFEESRQRFGAEKICATLAERGIKTSPKYVRQLMQDMGLYSVSTDSKREYKKRIKLSAKQNVLQQQFNPSEPNYVWVSDVTCFKVKENYFYICMILDLFSRKIIAYRISPRNSTYLITTTFKKAFEVRDRPENLTFHSDQGCQYTSNAFRKLLALNKVVQSFSKSRCPHDNAVAEAFFSTLKKEELYRTNYKSTGEFHKSVENYIIFYNTKRPHKTLLNKTPDQFEEDYYNKKS